MRTIRLAWLAIIPLACGEEGTTQAPPELGSLLVRWATADFCGPVAEVHLTLSGGTLTKDQDVLMACAPGERRFDSLGEGDDYRVRFAAQDEDGGVVQIAQTEGLTPDASAFDAGPPDTVYEDALVFDVSVAPGVESRLDLVLTVRRSGNDGGGYEDGGSDAISNNTDEDEDGVLDGIDNCTGVFNPSQVDADGDGAGDDCDCAPDDAGFPDVVAESTLDKDEDLMIAWTGDWTYEAGYYRQTGVDGISVAEIDAIESDPAVEAVIRFADTSGAAGIPQRGAGILLRAAAMKDAADTTGYICGVNVEAAVLFLARVDAGNFSGSGGPTVLATEPVTFTIEVGTGLAPYRLYAHADNDAYACWFQETDGDVPVVVEATDDTYEDDDRIGFVTFGAAVDFDYARVCGD